MNQDYLIVGDPHFENLPIIDNALINFFKEQIKPTDIVIFLGDVFSSFDIGIKNDSFYDYIESIDNSVIILCGNHDQSQGRTSIKFLKYFRDNIKVVKDYEFTDISDKYRFHFYNYFRYTRDIDFQLHSDKRNILFSHADLIPDNPIKGFSDMDLIFNGHLHDLSLSINKKIINTGSIRKTAINELDDKNIYRLTIGDEELLIRIPFKSVVDIQRKHIVDINEDLVFDRPTILNVQFSGHENKKEELEKIKKYKWYDENNIILKDELIKDDSFILETLTNIETTAASFDFMKIFSDYYDFYVNKYGVKDLNKDEITNLFKKHYDKIKETFNDFKINNLNFISVECENFTLFEKAKVEFDKLQNRTIFIKGENRDEVVDDQSTSNGSGKSNFSGMILYTLLGVKSKIIPLRRKTKSGYTKLVFTDNDDVIEFTRKFNKSGNDVFIEINKEPFYKDETNTNKLELFFKKYNFLDAIQFIFLSNNGFVDNFFNSKSSSDTDKIFRDIFPIIRHVKDIMEYIKSVLDEEKKKFGTVRSNLDHMKEIRSLKYKSIKEQLDEIKNSDVNKTLITDLQNEIKTFESDILPPDYLKSDLDQIYDFISNDNEFNIIKKIYKLDYQVTLNGYNVKKQINILNDNISNFSLKDFKVDNELDNLDINKLYQDLVDKDKNQKMILIQSELTFTKEEIKKLLEKNIDSKYEELSTYKNKMAELKKLGEEYTKLNNEIVEDEKNNIGVECDKCGNIVKDPSVKKFIDNKKNKLNEILLSGKNLRDEIDSKREYFTNLENNINELINKIDKINNVFNKYNVKSDDYINYEIKDNKIFSDLQDKIHAKKKYDEDKIRFREYERTLEEINKLKEVTIILPDITESDFIKYYQRVEKIKKIFPDLEVKDLKNFVSKQLGLCDIYHQKINQLDTKKKEFDIKKVLFDEQIKKIQRIKIDLEDTQKKYNIRTIKKEYEEIDKDYKLLGNLYYIINNRGITFEKYFINIFFEQIEKIFNILLSFLFERKVELKISDLNFIFKDEGEDCFYNSFSGGEKIKISLCFLLTFNIIFQEYGTKSNIQWIDEFLDQALDEVNSKRVFKLLQHYFKGLLFIVSHKPFFNEFIETTINIIRKNGVSEIFIKGV
jgi:hypothetical protein